MSEELYLDYMDVEEGEQESVLLVFNNGEKAEIRPDGIYLDGYIVTFSAIIGTIKRAMRNDLSIKS